MIQRELLAIIREYWFKGKAIVIYGPRQVGKSTLLEMLSVNLGKKSLFLNCDEPDVRKDLTEVTSTQLKQKIGDAEVVFIDEAQRIKNIGITLKLITDQLKQVQLIITGSSAFELSNDINESLTGRKFEFQLLPVSTSEMINHTDALSETRLLESRLIFGMYPDIINNPGNERVILNNLVGSYLFKDVFSFQDIRKPEFIAALLEALALQLGSEVSYHELAGMLGIDQLTIKRYIDLLEKTFVIFRLRAFSRNHRNEIKKSRKIFFYDNGVRNAIIGDFNHFSLRTDKGPLWENFLISERMKKLKNNNLFVKSYFWRTRQQQEIDYLEESDGKMYAFEFKWSRQGKARIPKTFLTSYPDVVPQVISKDNYREFVG